MSLVMGEGKWAVKSKHCFLHLLLLMCFHFYIQRLVGAAYALIISMYPFVPYEVFEDVFDINYNLPMQRYNESIAPLLGFLEEAVENEDYELAARLRDKLDKLK